ncbi:glycosyltransferase family 2 protein [Candidatus Bathyarchaeota archaeon]|nr:glycosyltransferase family 2 protein [Candidatus Bathyarchaeota archaeon]
MSNKWPMVSVVVINFRGTDQLEKCLTYLMRTNYPNYEVIIVDCLTENLESWTNQHFPKAKIVHYAYDIGPSASHNVGKAILNPESKYLAFLDNDAYVTENWLTELVKVMESNEKIGVAQAKILMTSNKKLMDNAGLAIDALGTWYTPRGLKADNFQTLTEIFAASSAGCLVRLEAFEKVGGFDPEYFIYDDDTDFSFRVRLLGYKIVFVPTAVVFHDGDPVRALNPRKLWHSVKNRIFTMAKNYELKNLWWHLTLYSFLTFLAGIGFVLAGHFLEAKETFRGLFYPLVNFRRILEKRAVVQSFRKVGDAELFRSGFIKNDIRATVQDIKLKARQIL